MKTDTLVDWLAQRPPPAGFGHAQRRFALQLAGGALLPLLAMLALAGTQPAALRLAALPLLWVKLAFPALLCAACVPLLRRLGRPGDGLGLAPLAVWAAAAAMAGLAALVLWRAAPADRLALVLGNASWRCAAAIAALSVPVALAAFAALAGLAPTRLSLAGGVAGLFGGACGAFAYALYCTELQPPFVATWYGLGMLAPAALGAMLGPRLLRW